MTNVLVDADELIYKAAAAAEYDLEMGGTHVLMSDFGTTQRIFCDQEAKICEALGAEEVVMALSDTKNFRKDVLPTYKSNRKNTRKPLAFARLRQFRSVPRFRGAGRMLPRGGVDLCRRRAWLNMVRAIWPARSRRAGVKRWKTGSAAPTVRPSASGSPSSW